MRISDWRSDVCSSDLQAPGDERTGRVDVEGVEPEQRGARQQRRVHLAEGVLGGRADEGDEAALDAGEQGVLLRLARSEERRVGKEWGSTGRSRWSAYNSKNNK